MTPVTISKVEGGYQVRTPNQVHARRTTLAKAKAQERLLNAIEHNPDFKPSPKHIREAAKRSFKK